MAATTPMEIGTRGTVGSLLLQEIDYFKKLDLECTEIPRKSQPWIADMASTSNSRTTIGFSFRAQKKKKKRSSGFLPSICSVVEIANGKQDRMPVLSYRNLKLDVKKM